MTKNKNLNTVGELKAQLNIPKTETRIILNDWQSEVKTSRLSSAARAKVVNQSGSNYISFRTGISNSSYGPGIDGAETKYCAASGCYERIDDSLTYCSKHSQVSSSSTSTSVARSFADQVVKYGGEVEVKEENWKAETQSGTKIEYHSSSITYRKK